MKKSLNLVFLLPILAIVLTGSRCKEPDPPKPEIYPCFTLENDTFMDPREPVQFLNCSEKATSYHWYFGDGGESDVENPSHLFASPGVYEVTLSAQNGDFQELLQKRINVDYPRFKKIRIVQMAVLDHWGVPYDPDGSGLDITAFFTKAGDHSPTFGFPFVQNVTLPYEYDIPIDVSINSYFWQFELDCYRFGRMDTVGLGTIFLTQLFDSPIETRSWDSNLVEIIMEGAR